MNTYLQNSELMLSAIQFYQNCCRAYPETDSLVIAAQIEYLVPGFSRGLTMRMLDGSDVFDSDYDRVILLKVDDIDINQNGSLRVQLVKTIRDYFTIGLAESVNLVDSLCEIPRLLEAPVKNPDKKLTSRLEFSKKMRKLGIVVREESPYEDCQ